MTINQIEAMTDNTTMCIAVVFILVITILVAIAAMTAAFQKKSVNKKPQNAVDDLVYKIPSYTDPIAKFIFDESIRDLSEEISLSDSAQAVVNTYNK